MQKFKIAAAVILYNPPDDFIDNILLYVSDVEVVYVIDNSGTYDDERTAKLGSLQKIITIRTGDNVGVAKALNMAAERAIEAGYNLLLTMDQDSKTSSGMIPAMLDCLSARKSDIEHIAIISPLHLYKSLEPIERYLHKKPCEEVLTTMTSGNLLNLQAYKLIGPFLEDLFIDYVDHEYCLRLSLMGFKTVRANMAVLDHALGNTTVHTFIGKRLITGHYPPIRRYYAFRNKLFLRKKYKDIFSEHFYRYFRSLPAELFTIIFYETNSWNKLRMMLRGYLDYRKGVYGKYVHR